MHKWRFTPHPKQCLTKSSYNEKLRCNAALKAFKTWFVTRT